MKLIVFSWIVLMSNILLATEGNNMELSCKNMRIKIGDPLFVRITQRHKTPQVNVNTNKRAQILTLHFIRFRVNKLDGTSKVHKLTPSVNMFINKEDRTSYSGVIEILFDEHGFIFDDPGVYDICWVSPDEKEISNIVQIEVKELTEKEKEALDTIKHPDDYIFLLSGLCKKGTKTTIMSRLKKYINRAPNTILAKRIKVRIGLEHIKELEKRYGDFEEFKREYQIGTAEEPLIDKTIHHLDIALQLSDDFPDQQEVLYHLAILEYIKDNYKRSFLLLEELSSKYSMSKYGKKAEQTKRELNKLQQREKEESKEQKGN